MPRLSHCGPLDPPTALALAHPASCCCNSVLMSSRSVRTISGAAGSRSTIELAEEHYDIEVSSDNSTEQLQ